MTRNNVFAVPFACVLFLMSVLCPGRNPGPDGILPLRDSTLRVDYIFSGTDSSAVISLDRMSCSPGWYGRRVNMDCLPVSGNGRITMKDASTGKVLYRNSFSTLFQEWQTTEEATRVCRAFENVYLLPMPSAQAEITVELFDVKGRRTAFLTHGIDPADILIRCSSPSMSCPDAVSSDDAAFDAAVSVAAVAPESRVAPHRYIHRGGSPKECIDVAIVAEGYTAGEAEIFYADAQAAADEILSYDPFCRYRDRFNMVAVALPSADSGVSVPLEGEWKDTPLHSHFSTFYMDRYLTTLNLKDLHDALAGIPYEHVIILANTGVYGGGGIYNSYTLTTAHHSQFRPVVVHEFGHSFGALADEYYYDDMYVEYYYPDVEPWEQNITTLHDFSGKWENLLGEGTPVPTPAVQENRDRVGVYEGAGYQSKGVYRGYQTCRMLDNRSESFCPVCRQAIERMILFHLEQDDYGPAAD